ncbi:Tetratricopeptide repeat-containing protein [Amycolatopsis xylanica]|uniref:Tetratricopeptide repeat-containing protein n=2 Tax=Amycolatopsis xylanica TaxID=589385 RepID=A0A1H3HFH2_9PSEU|nr:tetratricopeptide repeat protein [Amycolatopsis xylanica]SDY13534.1 Tetratricopeptide repeat-containing protein [Amycolatopsis xylanica]
MGGVGKTSLARAYAQRYQREYGLVWWVHAEEHGTIDRDFRSLLELLVPYRAERVNDPVARVHEALLKERKPWLLILDNVTDPAAAYGLVPATGDGLVLITSQSAHWPGELSVGVGQLGLDSSIELLLSLSQDDDERTAEALAEELGRLPLALVQAGSFARANAVELATYLRLYRTHRAELHQVKQIHDDYAHTIATTWQVAIDRLPPSARTVLNLLCCYASDAIPVAALLSSEPGIALPQDLAPRVRPLLRNELTRHRAVGELLAYSLITPTDGKTASSVNVHRLVQAVNYDRLVSDDTMTDWVTAAHDLMLAISPCALTDAETVERWRAVHPHLHAVVEHLPAEAAATLDTREQLANLTGQGGNARQARDELATLLPLRERVHGSNDHRTLTARNNLAFWTGAAGEPRKACLQLVTLLSLRRRLYGAEDPRTLTVRHNFAFWIGKAGKHAKARDHFARLLPVRERVLGHEHPHALLTRSNLARWTGHAGDPASARDMFAELLVVSERVLGPEHPDTLATCGNYAFWTGRAGNAAVAANLFFGLVALCETVLGPEHPTTFTIRANFDHWSTRSNSSG